MEEESVEGDMEEGGSLTGVASTVGGGADEWVEDMIDDVVNVEGGAGAMLTVCR